MKQKIQVILSMSVFVSVWIAINFIKSLIVISLIFFILGTILLLKKENWFSKTISASRKYNVKKVSGFLGINFFIFSIALFPAIIEGYINKKEYEWLLWLTVILYIGDMVYAFFYETSGKLQD